MIFRTSRLVGYVSIPWRVTPIFEAMTNHGVFSLLPARLVTGSGKFLHVWSLDDEVRSGKNPPWNLLEPFLGTLKELGCLKNSRVYKGGPTQKKSCKGHTYPFIRSCLGVKNLIYNW